MANIVPFAKKQPCPNCGTMKRGEFTDESPCPECGWWEPDEQQQSAKRFANNVEQCLLQYDIEKVMRELDELFEKED